VNKFDAAGAVVGVDQDTGDAIVYADGGAASFYRGTWHPGRVFDWRSVASRDSRFSAVNDPAEVQRYLDAARDVLFESLASSDE
jgi:hypothetical protein